MARWGRRTLAIVRTLHIYLTMLVLLALVFFGTTGLLLNHERWFDRDQPRVSTRQGSLPAELLAGPDKLMIVERLRADFGAIGAMDSFDVDEDRLLVVFKRPGGRVEADIDRETGETEITSETTGLSGVITDLHKGAEAGTAWGWLIDVTAAGLLLASVTGIVLWLALPKRRLLGILCLLGGVITWTAVYFFFVP